MHELFIQLLEAVAPERIWKSGHRSGAKCGEKKLLVMPLHFFLAIKVQLVVLVSAFVMVSTVWSVSFLVFFYSRCPRAQSFVKVGARAPRALWSRRHWSEDILYRYATATVCACLYVMYICVKVEDGNAGKCGSGDYGNPRCIFFMFSYLWGDKKTVTEKGFLRWQTYHKDKDTGDEIILKPESSCCGVFGARCTLRPSWDKLVWLREEGCPPQCTLEREGPCPHLRRSLIDSRAYRGYCQNEFSWFSHQLSGGFKGRGLWGWPPPISLSFFINKAPFPV